MNASELAQAMLEWEEMKRALNQKENNIKEAVLVLEKTQTVGNVRATYSKGRGEYDYEQAYDDSGIDAGQVILHENSKTTYDWKSICKILGIEVGEDYYTLKSGPSVSVKLLED